MKTKLQVEHELNLASQSIEEIKNTIENEPSKYEEKSLYEGDVSILNKQLTLLRSLKKDIEELTAQDEMSLSKQASYLKEKQERLISASIKLLETLTDWKHSDKGQNPDRTTEEDWKINAEKNLELVDKFRLLIDQSKLDSNEGEIISYQDILDNIRKLTEAVQKIIKTCPHNSEDFEILKVRCFEAIDLLHVQDESIYLLYKKLSNELLSYEKKSNSFEFLIRDEKNLIKLPKLMERFLDELKNPNNYVFTEHKKKYEELIDKTNQQLVIINQKINQKRELENKLFELNFINPIQENLAQLHKGKTRLLFLIYDTIKLLASAESRLKLLNDLQLNHSYLPFIKENLEQFSKLRKNYDVVQSYLSNKVLGKKSRPLYQICFDKIQSGELLSLSELMQLYSKKGHRPNLFEPEEKSQFKTTLKSIFDASCFFLHRLREYIGTQTQFSFLSKKHPIEYSQKEINQILEKIREGDPLRELLKELMPNREEQVAAQSSSPP